MVIDTSKETVFSTRTMEIVHCDLSNSFVLDTGSDTYKMNLCTLIVMKRKLAQLDILSILEDHTTPDIEIVSLTSCERLIVLDIYQILELKELLNGTFVMLELNSIIHAEIIRPGLFK